MLPWAEFWFNTSHNRSINTTPFKALYGRDPPTIFKWQDDSSAVEEVNQQLRERNEMLHLLKSHLEQAQSKMQQQANKKRRDVTFEVGDKVYLRIHPYKLKNLAKRQHEKLAPRYYGPYEIIQKIGQVAYKLHLPETARIHPVFHVSQLKKSVFPTEAVQPLPNFLSEEYELQVQPQDVIAVRKITDGSTQVLIKWSTLPDCENTWEDMAAIRNQFPNFPLEDKVNLVEGANDGPNIKGRQVYKRRGLKPGHGLQQYSMGLPTEVQPSKIRRGGWLQLSRVACLEERDKE